jgi:signal transduction histidine kinase
MGIFPVQLAHIYYGLANVNKINDPGLSLSFAKKSLGLAVKYEVLDLIANNHKLMSEVYSAQGNDKLALAEYKLYDVASDSVYSIDAKESISLLEANYKVAKSTNELEKLSLINEKNNLEKSTYLLIAIATFIVVIILVYSLRKRNALNIKLNKSNNVKDKLLSIIAHDLKSPLHNIITVLNEIDQNTFTKEDQTKIIKDLTSQTDVTLETLENLLKWGQAQLKGVNVNVLNFELKHEVDKNVDLFQAQLFSKQISIEINIPSNLTVKYDKDHFDFIIRNLLANAIKFSYSGSKIIIDSETIEDSKVKLNIRDNGIGIPYTYSDSIFQPSPKVRLGTNNEKGSGLALSLCKEFSEANGSVIGFDSIDNQGTCFYLIIKK